MKIDINNMTQEQLESLCDQCRDAYNKELAESGLSQAMFQLKNTSFVMAFAQTVLTLQEHAKEQGLVMPVVVEGVIVREKVAG